MLGSINSNTMKIGLGVGIPVGIIIIGLISYIIIKKKKES